MRLVKKIKSLFLGGDARSIAAKKNILLSLVFKGGSVILSLLLIRLTIKYVNPVQYGVWLTLSSLIAWFNFFDIGLGNGLRNKVAESNAKDDNLSTRAFISSTYGILICISCILFVCFFVGNLFIDWESVLNIHNQNALDLNLLALIVFGSFCIQFILQTISNVLTALHLPGKVAVINFVGQLISFLVIFLLTKTTKGSLLYLTVALTTIPLFVLLVATVYFFKTKFKEYSPNIRLVSFKHLKELFGIGGIFFLIQIGGLMLFQTDNIIITQIFGPEQVTNFNVVYKLFSIITLIFTIVISPFWSSFTDAYARGDLLWIKNMMTKIQKIWIVFVGAAIVLFFLAPFAYKVWLNNPSIIISHSLNFSMMLYVIAFSWQTIHVTLLNGIGKIRLQLYLVILSALINVPLAILLSKFFGVAGITLANTLVFLVMGCIFALQGRKILNGNANGLMNR